MLIHSSKELAEYLRDRRKRQKLSQAEIGDRVGIMPNHLDRATDGIFTL
jgi:transcriptional regulator with XRE-family HTH domain